MQLDIRIKMNEKLYLRNPEDSAVGKRIVSQGLILINKLGFEDFTFKKLSIEIDTTTCTDAMNVKHAAFSWFRLVVLKLCENIELEQLRDLDLGNRKFHHILKQQRNLIFNKLLLGELKELQQNRIFRE